MEIIIKTEKERKKKRKERKKERKKERRKEKTTPMISYRRINTSRFGYVKNDLFKSKE